MLSVPTLLGTIIYVLKGGELFRREKNIKNIHSALIRVLGYN